MNRTPHPMSSPASLAEWVVEINSAFTGGRTSVMRLAEIVCAAKRKGEMLVVIGKELGSLDAQNSAHLPAAWNTLYCLARLPRAVLLKLIQERTVHPTLTLGKAQELLNSSRSRPTKSDPPPVKARISRFKRFVQDTLCDWTAEQRQTAHVALAEIAEQIGTYRDAPRLQNIFRLSGYPFE